MVVPLPPITVEKIFCDTVPKITEEAPVRESTSIPKTLENPLLIVEAEAMARVSVPKPPEIESLASKVALAMVKESAYPPG